MEIFVLIKKVPDPNLPEQFVTVSEAQDEIVFHQASQYSVNLYDLNAVECAIGLKEAHGGSVTVVTADDASADQYLRRALSMGADRAIRVELAAGDRRDPFKTARAIVGAIQQQTAPSLIIAGRQASDTDAGYVPFLVAHGLRIPALSPIVAIRAVAANSMVVGKLCDASIDDYEIALPALLVVSNEMNKPRTPSLKGVMTAKKASIELSSPPTDDVNAVRPKYAPKKRQRAAQTTQFVNGSDEEKAAALLAALGK
ncbi:electron transfer flavoprotein subunit beta/FixA family protein [Bradyrhizobium sp. Arg314]